MRIVGKYAGAWLGCLAVKKDRKVRDFLGLALVPQAGVAIGLAALGARTLGGQTGVAMIPFAGDAKGPLFSGSVIGPGVDTQLIGPDGRPHLSARYMLEGQDAAGNACRVFIENQGTWEEGFTPSIVTDSPLLRPWETARLGARVDPAPGGVTVTVVCLDDPA